VVHFAGPSFRADFESLPNSAQLSGVCTSPSTIPRAGRLIMPPCAGAWILGGGAQWSSACMISAPCRRNYCGRRDSSGQTHRSSGSYIPIPDLGKPVAAFVIHPRHDAFFYSRRGSKAETEPLSAARCFTPATKSWASLPEESSIRPSDKSSRVPIGRRARMMRSALSLPA